MRDSTDECGPAPLPLVGRGRGRGHAAPRLVPGNPSPSPLHGLPSPHKGERVRPAFAVIATLLLAACETAKPRRDYLKYRSSQDPVSASSHIAERVRACWFAEGRDGFRGYSYTPELNSYSGRPRVLIVSADDPTGLPKLVIEATAADRGTSVKLFGPMLASREGPAIAGDVERWAGGASGC